MPGMRLENKDVYINKETPDDTSPDTLATSSTGYRSASMRLVLIFAGVWFSYVF